MLASYRRQLTSWFVALFLLLYLVGGGIAAFVFDSVLTAQLDEDLLGLRSEIRPLIDQSCSQPSLKSWYQNVQAHHQRLYSTVQIFNDHNSLLEEYGTAGVPRLTAGSLCQTINGKNISVRSSYRRINDDNPQAGYIQVQISTKHRDDAVYNFCITLAILAPFFALVVWVAGYFFSARATAPVVQTMALLRRFVADAGHEFNTPITVIEASVQTLDEDFKERGLSTEILEVIARASARMKDLAAKLMLLAKIENPEAVANMVPLDLNEVLTPVVEEFTPLAARKMIKLNWKKSAPLPVIGNAESLRTLISNLIDNALAYSEPGGKISIAVTNQLGTTTLIVEDSGIGIPKESIPHIFERFYRVDKSRSRAVGGSGLGLSIVKAIVDNHNGTIKAESQIGVGTKFIVSLKSSSL